MHFINRILLLFVFSFWLVSCSTSSKVPLTNDELSSKLKTHILTLASDEFEGREAGTEGEKKASDYISKEFKKIGLSKKGTDGYLQEFSFTEGAKLGSSNQLIVNVKRYSLNNDFYPLPYSSNGIITGYVVRVGHGIVDEQLKRNDYLGTGNINKKIFVIESGTPDGNNPHGKFGEWTDLRKKIDVAIAKGALAVIFINSDSTQENPKADWNFRISPSTIPVLFAKGEAAKVLKDSIVTNCTLGTEIEKVEKKGHNVIGYVDNGAAHTIVIGAHYDHLGYGDEGSLYRGEKAIHNGADDNASGTGALIELARYVKASGMKNNNYLFMAFSGEEKGLLGSNYFVKHPTIDLKSVSYMLNMDMVGRLKPDEKILIINGSGTTPRWKGLLDSVTVDNIKLKETESGVGPSDHTSFYLQDIPVLHFFSGTHPDYHKPSDDEDKINYPGAVSITNIIKNILQKTDSPDKLVFSKTNDSNNEDAPKFKVTLGVVPDYAFEGEGMRIDGVTDDRPAAKAGLEPGDVVIQLGEHKVLDMMSYMKALSKFSKGETTKVKVIRNHQEIEKDITF
ncbi:MAG: M28 family peptidase [Bacteroidetes bacterium]|nr:MAG: M28 family peptidase [Bacteroidota bacterium]